MNDSELNKVLRSARVPDRSAEYWDEFPLRVLRQLRRLDSSGAAVSRSRSRLTIWGWGVSLGAVCLAFGFWFGFSRGNRSDIDQGSLAESAKLIREVASLFPNRVRAIVTDDNGVRLVLSDQANVPASTPLLIKVCQGRTCQSITTFSGQEIQVAGNEFEVLADARGNVLLVGDHVIWTSVEPGRRLSSLKIEARTLETML